MKFEMVFLSEELLVTLFIEVSAMRYSGQKEENGHAII